MGDGFASRHSAFDMCVSDVWSAPPVIYDHEPLSVRVACDSTARISYILAGLDWAASMNETSATVLIPDEYRGHPLVEGRLDAMRASGMEITATPVPVCDRAFPVKWVVVTIVSFLALSSLAAVLALVSARSEPVPTRMTVPPRRWSNEATRPPNTAH